MSKSTLIKMAIGLIITLSLSIFAQGTMEDVVYLKNGSIIHGVIVEQVPNQSIKIKTKDGNIYVYSISDIEKITKETSTNPVSSSVEGSKPISSQIVIHPLGFLQAGPIIQVLFKIAPNTVIGPHVRFAGLGLLYVENVSSDADEVSPSSIAGGIEVKYFFDNPNSPDRWYLGGLAEYGYGSWSGAVGYSDEWKGEHYYWDFLINGGYCWRFSHGILLNLGAFMGVAQATKRQWWYVVDPSYKFPDDTYPITFLYMLELSLGIEL